MGSLKATWKSGIFRLNLPTISRPHSSTFGCKYLSKTTSGENWKHLNYGGTTTAFSAQVAWQRGTVGKHWKVQYGDSTISHKAEVLPEA
jgi:hypothetical protein